MTRSLTSLSLLLTLASMPSAAQADTAAENRKTAKTLAKTRAASLYLCTASATASTPLACVSLARLGARHEDTSGVVSAVRKRVAGWAATLGEPLAESAMLDAIDGIDLGCNGRRHRGRTTLEHVDLTGQMSSSHSDAAAGCAVGGSDVETSSSLGAAFDVVVDGQADAVSLATTYVEAYAACRQREAAGKGGKGKPTPSTMAECNESSAECVTSPKPRESELFKHVVGMIWEVIDDAVGGDDDDDGANAVTGGRGYCMLDAGCAQQDNCAAEAQEQTLGDLLHRQNAAVCDAKTMPLPDGTSRCHAPKAGQPRSAAQLEELFTAVCNLRQQVAKPVEGSRYRCMSPTAKGNSMPGACSSNVGMCTPEQADAAKLPKHGGKLPPAPPKR